MLSNKTNLLYTVIIKFAGKSMQFSVFGLVFFGDKMRREKCEVMK